MIFVFFLREGFDIALQWSVASGVIISDLVHTWGRKSQSFGLSLMPIPSDPFALPITQNSDPVSWTFIKFHKHRKYTKKHSWFLHFNCVSVFKYVQILCFLHLVFWLSGPRSNFYWIRYRLLNGRRGKGNEPFWKLPSRILGNSALPFPGSYCAQVKNLNTLSTKINYPLVYHTKQYHLKNMQYFKNYCPTAKV